MTDPCRDLDPYLAGDLTAADAERFERHALACDACDAALALPADLGAAFLEFAGERCPPDVLAAAQASADGDWPPAWPRELRALSSATCPPDVLAAALRQTRQAPDRAPARHRQRRAWAWALAALVAVGVSWAALQSATDAPVQVADEGTETPAAAPPAAAQNPDDPEPDKPDPIAPAPPVAAPPPAPPQTPRPAPPVATPSAPLIAERSLEPAPAGPAPDLQATPDLTEHQPTVQEIEDAQRDLALAFALVADAQSAAGAHVREQAQALGSTLNNTSPF